MLSVFDVALRRGLLQPLGYPLIVDVVNIKINGSVFTHGAF